MPFSLNEIQKTNTATTQDWLRVSEGMTISAYDPSCLTSTPFQGDLKEKTEDINVEPLFGSHIRETVDTVKEWLGRK